MRNTPIVPGKMRITIFAPIVFNPPDIMNVIVPTTKPNPMRNNIPSNFFATYFLNII